MGASAVDVTVIGVASAPRNASATIAVTVKVAAALAPAIASTLSSSVLMSATSLAVRSPSRRCRHHHHQRHHADPQRQPLGEEALDDVLLALGVHPLRHPPTDTSPAPPSAALPSAALPSAAMPFSMTPHDSRAAEPLEPLAVVVPVCNHSLDYLGGRPETQARHAQLLPASLYPPCTPHSTTPSQPCMQVARAAPCRVAAPATARPSCSLRSCTPPVG